MASIKLTIFFTAVTMALCIGAGCKSTPSSAGGLSSQDEAIILDRQIRERIAQIDDALKTRDEYNDRSNMFPEKPKIVMRSLLKDHFADGSRNKHAQALLRDSQLYLDDLREEIKLYHDVDNLDFFDPPK